MGEFGGRGSVNGGKGSGIPSNHGWEGRGRFAVDRIVKGQYMWQKSSS